MREATGNLWDLVQPTEAIVITTNGDVGKNGRAVMGRGIALEAKRRVQGIDRLLADQILRYGNHAWFLARGQLGPQFSIIFMPVKHHWHEAADPALIVRSAREMVHLADREQAMYARANLTTGSTTVEWANIWMPRPGCGAGRLDWGDVKPLIAPVLDDRFVAVTFDAS